MPIEFAEDLVLEPLPVTDLTAAVLARQHAASIAAAGGRMPAAQRAVDAILARPVDEAASEHGRMQRLFAQVYTRAELERLMLATFETLGLRA